MEQSDDAATLASVEELAQASEDRSNAQAQLDREVNRKPNKDAKVNTDALGKRGGGPKVRRFEVMFKVVTQVIVLRGCPLETWESVSAPPETQTIQPTPTSVISWMGFKLLSST